MQITIASGKGGTGKTTIATNLAVTLAQKGFDVTYADCDVEEPNGHLFLKPEVDITIEAGTPNPQVILDKCDFCGECGKICKFSAIVVVGEQVLTFPELCHGCGGCALVCPEKAIEEVDRIAGYIDIGRAFGLSYISGRLNIGEAMPVPIVRKVKQNLPHAEIVIIDAPPGTTCPVIEAVKGSDYVILVTEPTPFGLNDLIIAADMVRTLRIPFGVLLNRADIGDRRVQEYCANEGIELIYEIPHSRKAAEAYARGELLTLTVPEFKGYFDYLAEKLITMDIEKQVLG